MTPSQPSWCYKSNESNEFKMGAMPNMSNFNCKIEFK